MRRALILAATIFLAGMAALGVMVVLASLANGDVLYSVAAIPIVAVVAYVVTEIARRVTGAWRTEREVDEDRH